MGIMEILCAVITFIMITYHVDNYNTLCENETAKKFDIGINRFLFTLKIVFCLSLFIFIDKDYLDYAMLGFWVALLVEFIKYIIKLKVVKNYQGVLWIHLVMFGLFILLVYVLKFLLV
jgi:hypothetical protein